MLLSFNLVTHVLLLTACDCLRHLRGIVGLVPGLSVRLRSEPFPANPMSTNTLSLRSRELRSQPLMRSSSSLKRVFAAVLESPFKPSTQAVDLLLYVIDHFMGISDSNTAFLSNIVWYR